MTHDVIVIGAGAAGLSATRELSAAGKDVLLLDRVPDIHWWSERGKFTRREDFWQRVAKILSRAANTTVDIPFAEFLRRSRFPAADRKLVARFVEGYHAADIENVSCHSLAASDAEQHEADLRIASQRGQLA